MRFKDKVVIITGGASGIGAATAECFISEGASVVICSKSNKAMGVSEKFKKRYKNKRIMPFVGDVSQEDYAIKLVRNTVLKFGKVDILVNSAGVSAPGKVDEITLAAWDYIIDNNLTNCFLCCKHVLAPMKKRKYGKIVNISSIAGRFRSSLAGAHYAAAKAAIIAFSRQLAFEVARYNINVNVLCPSQTMTPMLKKFLTPKNRKRLEDSIPLGYIASPLEQAKVILFLASDDSSYMTGTVVDVNGGQL